MVQFITIIKKYKLPIGATLLAVIIFSIAIVLRQNAARRELEAHPTPTPTPTLAPIGIGGDIGQLTNKLGTPIGGNPAPQDGIAEYKSKNLTFNDQVVYSNGKATFFKQMILVEEKRTGKGLQQQLGKPQVVLYGPSSEFGYHLYAYPAKGTAYVANEGTDNVTEVWYFNPTTLETFMSTWATEYSTSPIDNGF